MRFGPAWVTTSVGKYITNCVTVERTIPMSVPVEALEPSVVKSITVKVKKLTESLDQKRFEKVIWEGVDFGQSITNCEFADCVFRRCKFPSIMRTVFKTCEFLECVSTARHFQHTVWSRCAFVECVLESVTFSKCEFERTNCGWVMSRVTVDNTKFVESSMDIRAKSCILRNAMLERSRFPSSSCLLACTFDTVTLRGVTIHSARFDGTRYMKCVFDACNIGKNTKMVNCTWEYCTFKRGCVLDSELVGAQMVYTSYDATQFMRNDLYMGRIDHVTFKGGDFAYNNLQKAHLRDITFDACDTRDNRKTDTVFCNVDSKGKEIGDVVAWFKPEFKDYRTSYSYTLTGLSMIGTPVIEVVVSCESNIQKWVTFPVKASLLRQSQMLQITKASTSTFASLLPFSAVSDEVVFSHLIVGDQMYIATRADVSGVEHVGFVPKPRILKQRSNSI